MSWLECLLWYPRYWVHWARAQWYERLRRIDEQVLWPSMRNQATDIEMARDAFMLHALHDEAWLALGMEELQRRVERLD
jgi:hypothetical protein